jgi:nitrite reductase (cytochrome c-552)
VNPIGCQDCHDPATMRLRITRPRSSRRSTRMGLNIERRKPPGDALARLRPVPRGVLLPPKDNYLVFPWDENGIDADAQEQFLDASARGLGPRLSRAPMIKVQHPDYELYQTSVHAYRGVACADCHMPFRREGGIKFTNHHIRARSPTSRRSCLVCHGGTERRC